ncbi:hypothetical protein AHF37_08060 [Paragonimus kellicotti]|nr:hypothetical protein AHF37_08060 [Paragonimus kellicotti]
MIYILTGCNPFFQVTCIPFGLGKFDSVLVLQTHDDRTRNLSVCGTVVAPKVRLSSKLSDFGGVHVGGSSFVSFGIENLGLTGALVELNFTDHPEFSISDQPCGQLETGQKNFVDMQARCLEVPTNQAFHSNEEVHMTSSGQPIVRRNSKQVKSKGKILIPPNFHWEGSLCFSPTEQLTLTCLDNAPVGWALGLIGVHQLNKNGKGLLELRDQNDTLLTSNVDGILEGTLANINDCFQFVLRFTPRKPGSFQLSLPLWLNKSVGKSERPESVQGERSPERTLYRSFQIHIRVTEAHLICSPSRVLFPTIPLGCEIRQIVELRSTRVDRSLSLSVCWPVPENVQPETVGHTADLECPFIVEFPDGHANPSDCKTGSSSFDRRQANQRLACVAVPISAAVDNSLTSWFDLVSRQPNSFTIGFVKNSLDVERKLTKTKLIDSGAHLKHLYNLTGEIQLIQSCSGPDGSQQSLVSITNSSGHVNGSLGIPTTESLYSDSGTQLTVPDVIESGRASPGAHLKHLYNLTGEIQLIQSCSGPDGSQQSLVSITNSSGHVNGSLGIPTTESLYSDSGTQLTVPDVIESGRASPGKSIVPN